MALTLAVAGIEHPHVFGMLRGLIDAGCTLKSWWTDGDPHLLDRFSTRFPQACRVADRQISLTDAEIDVVILCCAPDERAALAIEAMEAGKDVMVDKPGCITDQQLTEIKAAVARTGRIWSVNFSEHFEVPCVLRAAELVRDGAIGRVVQTIALAPHRLSAQDRPSWFFDPDRSGGILADLASHQIDQFMFFTGSTTANILSASVANYANPDHVDLQDFGEIVLEGDGGHGYVRVDWYTPAGSPAFGDGRLLILGTKGSIELRKYMDIAGRPGTDHIFLSNDAGCEYISAESVPLVYFRQFVADVRERTETAMPQAHCFEVTRLALAAQRMARHLGQLARSSPRIQFPQLA